MQQNGHNNMVLNIQKNRKTQKITNNYGSQLNTSSILIASNIFTCWVQKWGTQEYAATTMNEGKESECFPSTHTTSNPNMMAPRLCSVLFCNLFSFCLNGIYDIMIV